MLEKKVLRVSLVLSIASLCMVLGLKGMGEEHKKPIKYYLEYNKELLPVAHKVIDDSRILHDMEQDAENVKVVKKETETEIKIIFPIDIYLAPLTKFIKGQGVIQRALTLFAGYRVNAAVLDSLTNQDILWMMMIADVLVATQSEQENFVPKKDILANLISFVSKSFLENKKQYYEDFLEGKGLLWLLVNQCPVSLQRLLCNKIKPVMGNEALVVKSPDHQALVLLPLRSGILAAGLKGGKLSLLNIRKNEMVEFIAAERIKRITSLVELANGDLVSCSRDEILLQWNVKISKTKILHSFPGETLAKVIQLKDGRFVIGTEWGSLIVFDPQAKDQHPITQEFQSQSQDRVGEVISIVELQDGQVATLLSEAGLVVSHFREKKPESEIYGLSFDFPCAMQKISNKIVAIAQKDGKIFFVEKVSDNTLKKTKEPVCNFNSPITCLEFLPDTQLIIGNDKNIVLFDFKTKVQETIFSSQTSPITFALVQDGRLAAGLNDGSIRLFSLAPVTLEQCIVSGLIRRGPKISEGKKDISILSRLISGLTLKKKTLIKEKIWSDDESWYVDKIFSDERIFNCFLSLPDTELLNIMLEQGKRIFRLAAEYLFDELTEKMQDKTYVNDEQKDIEKRLGVVSRLVRLLEVKNDDELMRYYQYVSEHAQKKEPFVIKKS